MKLLVTAVENRHLLDGFLAARGAPPLFSMPVGRLCNFVRWFCVREASEEDRRKFEADLFRPPPGSDPSTWAGPWAPEAETAALASLASSFG
jgi:hypothetical protein